MLKISPKANKALIILESFGESAFLAGGCVRDLVMEKTPSDWDIATSATPSKIEEIFKAEGFKTIPTGISHGTLTVLIDGEPLEITTFRCESAYSDHRHPDSVKFVRTPEQDVKRRDFTINGLLYNPKTGILDMVGGIDDIKSGVIRTIGCPDERFSEDALRIMRAMRFSSVLDFRIDEETSASMLKNRRLLNEISPERKREELNKMLTGKDIRIILYKYEPILETIIPEIRQMVGFEHNNPHHCYDVWIHTIVSVSNVPPELVLRLTMLLHDIGKPQSHTIDSYGISHYPGHAGRSAKIADSILSYLKYPNDIKERVLNLIKFHDVRFSAKPKGIKSLLAQLGEENFRLLLQVKKADISAQNPSYMKDKLDNIEEAERIFKKIIDQGECFSLKNLNINGKDLINLGIPQGKRIGSMLNTLLNMVINEEIPNEKEALINAAKKI